MLRFPSIPLLFRVLLATLFCVGFFYSPANVRADDGRPYIELPFPRDTRYEVTCGYTCYQHRGSMTYSVDFRVPEGDPIVAAAAGEVMAVTWEVGLPANLDLGDALIVYIDHGAGWFTRYVHLQGVTVEVGDVVQMGDVIGYSGKTGTQGAHLHFELKYGTSLHSPSVPIDELFDGKPPVADQAYLSNNGALRELPPIPAAPAIGTENTVNPTATPPLVSLPAMPWVAEPLILSTTTLTGGQSFDATFTLRNNTPHRLQLAMLGIAGRDAASPSLRPDLLFYDRTVILSPGREYRFNRTLTIEQAGDAELFVFALGMDDEWIPLSGSVAPVPVTVTAPVGVRQLYLPSLFSGAATAAPTAPLPAPASTATAVPSVHYDWLQAQR